VSPPSVQITSSTLAASFKDALSVDIVIVQWGISPYPVDVGWDAVPGVPTSGAGVFDDTNSNVSSLANVIIAAGLSSSTSLGLQSDAQPGRNGGGGDTRTTAVSLQTWDGTPVPLLHTNDPIIIVLPLAGSGVVESPGSNSTLTVPARQSCSCNIASHSCPTQADMAPGKTCCRRIYSPTCI